MSRKNEEVASNIINGCLHLYNNMYMIPFDAIRTPDDEESEGQYCFRNPRTLIERGQADLLDKKLSADLRESIKKNTLLNPLVCRWVYDEKDDCYHPVIVGGERRYRALDFLIRKKEVVKDPRQATVGELNNSTITADIAYAMVPCQIYSCDDDLDALALSWAENKNRVNLTDGHEIAEVIKLRQAEATDDKIMEILQQDRRWLAETDRLISNLDANTLADLLEGRIDRGSANNLSKVDPALRDEVREAANTAAQDVFERRAARLENRIESAFERQEIAEANTVLANTPESQQVAAQEVAETRAEINTMKRRKERLRPQTTSQQVLRATEEVTGTTRRRNSTPRTRNAHANNNTQLLEEMRTYLTDLIRRNGRCPENNFTAQIDALRLLLRVINENFAQNDGDLVSTLTRHYGSD